ncbi:hypothetical protein ACIP5Y_42240 [Nocardia sp. NPDC088792]|uniref:hypothetical protein n=1 Tax=Nocardia sp. NPDC088792 TaxID=3364332 RepID=UPI0037FF36CA
MTSSAGLHPVAVLDRRGGRVVVWHVNVGAALGLSRLSGAWVLGEEAVELGSLTVGRWVIQCSPDVGAPEGVAGVVDLEATVDAVQGEIDAADDAFSAHQETVASKLIRPEWPVITHPAEAGLLRNEVDEVVRPALGLARGLGEMADAWAAFESLRVVRPFLVELGGVGVRALPLTVR